MGIARQRKAIVDGLRDTVSVFQHDVNGTGAKDVMDLLLMTQYFDMIKDIGSKKAGSTIFLPHGPHAVERLRKDLSNSFASAATANVMDRDTKTF
jgi:Mor family transcriptional regulator